MKYSLAYEEQASLCEARKVRSNVKVPFTLQPPADLIARAKFSSHSLRNAHGRKNLLSFLAIRTRVLLLFVPMYGGEMEIFYVYKLINIYCALNNSFKNCQFFCVVFSGEEYLWRNFSYIFSSFSCCKRVYTFKIGI